MSRCWGCMRCGRKKNRDSPPKGGREVNCGGSSRTLAVIERPMSFAIGPLWPHCLAHVNSLPSALELLPRFCKPLCYDIHRQLSRRESRGIMRLDIASTSGLLCIGRLTAANRSETDRSSIPMLHDTFRATDMQHVQPFTSY